MPRRSSSPASRLLRSGGEPPGTRKDDAGRSAESGSNGQKVAQRGARFAAVEHRRFRAGIQFRAADALHPRARSGEPFDFGAEPPQGAAGGFNVIGAAAKAHEHGMIGRAERGGNQFAVSPGLRRNGGNRAGKLLRGNGLLHEKWLQVGAALRPPVFFFRVLRGSSRGVSPRTCARSGRSRVRQAKPALHRQPRPFYRAGRA